ncbi:MAG: carbohydrate kinase, partial [Planctomycetes bacterium]|nr:carbohydrate kinase [Planctomycetota bacterium]
MKHGDTENPLLLGLDLGTSAIKGVLTNAQGKLLAQAAADTHLLYLSDGRVEVAPEAHYGAVCGVIRELTAAAPGEVAALAMTGASGNTLLTDEHGRPLTPIISWMDRRSASCTPDAISDLKADEVARITGWPCLDSFPLAHLAWLREEDPVRFGAAAHYGMDTDWLLYRLTGLWRMDYSTATTFH